MIALALASRVFLAVSFGVGAAEKLRDPAIFVRAVGQYRLLPPALARPAAYALIAAEVLVAGGLLWLPGAWGPLAAIALLGLFALAMAVNLLRGRRQIACGCSYGAKAETIGWGLVARNGLLAAVALTGLAASGWPQTGLEWVDGLGAGLALYALGQVAPALRDLRAAARALRARSH